MKRIYALFLVLLALLPVAAYAQKELVTTLSYGDVALNFVNPKDAVIHEGGMHEDGTAYTNHWSPTCLPGGTDQGTVGGGINHYMDVNLGHSYVLEEIKLGLSCRTGTAKLTCFIQLMDMHDNLVYTVSEPLTVSTALTAYTIGTTQKEAVCKARILFQPEETGDNWINLYYMNFYATVSPVATIGSVRVTCLSDTALRVEVKGAKGFENRETYHVVGRKEYEGIPYTRTTSGNYEKIQTAYYTVYVPQNASSLSGIYVEQKGGRVWTYAGSISNKITLPAPKDTGKAFAFQDAPRITVPAWGYNNEAGAGENNGWDFNNQADDIYVLLPDGDAKTLRTDFVKLTGRPEFVPLWALGVWDSRYFAHTEASAEARINTYKNNDLPLDVLVLDTDWRRSIGTSGTGYEVNTDLFPDMAGFISRMHEKNIRFVFNDHPEPSTSNALSASEVNFRNTSLKKILDLGLDAWWYDRNWSTTIPSPIAGIDNCAFGAFVYHSIAENHLPEKRPMILCNADGIDNGVYKRKPDITSHRFSIQWTGDTFGKDSVLNSEIDNMVLFGAETAMPYLSTDVGGHLYDTSEEGYIRYVQYSALSPIYRGHSVSFNMYGQHSDRAPWTWGDKALTISRNYLKMRYRLLPLFYASAHESYETGVPIAKRLDFSYPQHKESARNDQYLLGEDILVAPMTVTYPQKDGGTPIPASWFSGGVSCSFYNNTSLSGNPVSTQTASNVEFDWGHGNPLYCSSDNYSARFTGTFTVGGTESIQLGIRADDGVRVWLNDELVLDSWGYQAKYLPINKTLIPGNTVNLKIEYFEQSDNAYCKLFYHTVNTPAASREVFIPDGTWMDVWTGTEYVGPTKLTVYHDEETSPLFVRKGAVLALSEDMNNTEEKTWENMALDIYPSETQEGHFTIYEDDRTSVAYRSGAYRTTDIVSGMDPKGYFVRVSPAVGSFDGSDAFDSRTFRVRIHAAENKGKIAFVTANGSPVDFSLLPRDEKAMPFAYHGSSPDSDVYMATVTCPMDEELFIRYGFSDNAAVYEQATLLYDSVTTPISKINLTQVGTTDYFHVDEKNIGGIVKKASPEKTVFVSLTNGNTPGLFGDARTSFSWTDGTPYATGGTTVGFTYNSHYTITGNICETPQKITVYLGGYGADSTLVLTDDHGTVLKTWHLGNARGVYDKEITFVVAGGATEQFRLTHTMNTGYLAGANITLLAASASPVTDSLYGGNRSMQDVRLTVSAPPSAVNLTEVGKIDYMHANKNALNSWVRKKDRKIPVLGTVSALDHGHFTDGRTTYSWSDGDLYQESGTTVGYCSSTGFTLTGKLSDTPRTFTVYIGGFNAEGTLTLLDQKGSVLASKTFSNANGIFDKAVTFTLTGGGDFSEFKLLYTLTRSLNYAANITFTAAAVTEGVVEKAPQVTPITVAPKEEADLSVLGQLDWQAFGVGGATHAERKAKSSNVAFGALHSQRNAIMLYDYQTAFSWWNGAGVTQMAEWNNGVYCNNEFTLPVCLPQDKAYLTCYVGGYKSAGEFTIEDEDGVVLYTQSFPEADGNAYYTVRVCLNGTQGQKVLVRYRQTTVGGNITFSAATLSDGLYGVRTPENIYTLCNQTETPVPMRVIIASYDNDGRLVHACHRITTLTDLEDIAPPFTLTDDSRLFFMQFDNMLTPLQQDYTAVYGDARQMQCSAPNELPSEDITWYRIGEEETDIAVVGTGEAFSPAYNLNAGKYTYFCASDTKDGMTTTKDITYTVAQRPVTALFQAEDRPYDGTPSAQGTLVLDNVVAGENLSCHYTFCSFDSPLVGERLASATGLVLDGASSNYMLTNTTASDRAVIQKATLDVDIISYLMNQTEMNDIKAKTMEKAAAQNITLPASCTIADSTGSIGHITDEIFNRTDTYHNALGILWDHLCSDVVVDGIPCVALNLTVTTGQPLVYGDNTTTYGEETAVVSYASEQNPWQIDNKARKIATNTPATAKLNVYLRKGERLKVDTAIGLYHGRMDVTVTKSDDSLILATDRIDAFFPVHYEESFYVSNLNNAVFSDTITQSGDYLDGVVPFTAPESGIYTFTFTVTGESYLHSIDDRYTQNLPAQKPVTELYTFTIEK